MLTYTYVESKFYYEFPLGTIHLHSIFINLFYED